MSDRHFSYKYLYEKHEYVFNYSSVSANIGNFKIINIYNHRKGPGLTSADNLFSFKLKIKKEIEFGERNPSKLFGELMSLIVTEKDVVVCNDMFSSGAMKDYSPIVIKISEILSNEKLLNCMHIGYCDRAIELEKGKILKFENEIKKIHKKIDGIIRHQENLRNKPNVIS